MLYIGNKLDIVKKSVKSVCKGDTKNLVNQILLGVFYRYTYN